MSAPKGNQYAKGNKGGGRVSAYQPKYIQQAKRAAQAGFTDIEIADLLGCSLSALYAWKLEHKEFATSLKQGKAKTDERVVRSLYARAMGYEHDEVDIRVVKGKIVKTPIRKYYPPDTAAAIFWLKNRRKDEWRDRHDHEHSGKDGGPIVISATPLDEAI